MLKEDKADVSVMEVCSRERKGPHVACSSDMSGDPSAPLPSLLSSSFSFPLSSSLSLEETVGQIGVCGEFDMS